VGIHQDRVHPTYVEGCFGCRVSHVGVAPSAMPTRTGGADAGAINAREARWQKDMPAYKRLRDQGYQPPHIDGSARLEAQASTEHEIAVGQVSADPKKLTEAADWFSQGTGHEFTQPAPVTP